MTHCLKDLPGATMGDWVHDRLAAMVMGVASTKDMVTVRQVDIVALLREYREMRLTFAAQDMRDQEGPDREEVREEFKKVLNYYGWKD